MALKWFRENAGITATAGAMLLGAFQGSIVLGAPLCKASWGGGSSELPVCFRVGRFRKYVYPSCCYGHATLWAKQHGLFSRIRSRRKTILAKLSSLLQQFSTSPRVVQ